MYIIKLKYIYRPVAFILVMVLVLTGAPCLYAQTSPAGHLALLNPSQAFNPLILKGMIVDPADPLQFKFIVGQGETHLTDRQLREEVDVMLKYFLAALAMPEKDIWVNLSPYESNRIIPDKLAQTDMGKTLLAQDYLLKQLAASLTYPETEIGKKYWDEINNPTNSFNKVWIVPDSAVVYQDKGRAYLGETHLKVMMESDYVATQKNNHVIASVAKQSQSKIATVGDSLLRNDAASAFKQHILPMIEKEVNTGKTFAPLRQVFNAIVLAIWFKQTLKQTLLGQGYANKKNTNGIDGISLTEREKIYNQYLKAFQQGAYDYIKSERVVANGRSPVQKITKRRYFSGGVAVPAGFAADGMRQAPLVEAHTDGKDLVVSAVGGESADDLFAAVNAIFPQTRSSGISLKEFYRMVAEISDKLPPAARADRGQYLDLLTTIFSGSKQAIDDKLAITEYFSQLNPDYNLLSWKVTNILKVAQAVGNGEALAALRKLLMRASAKQESPEAINPGVAALALLMTLSLRAAGSDNLALVDLYALLEQEGVRSKGLPFSDAVTDRLIDSISEEYGLDDPEVFLESIQQDMDIELMRGEGESVPEAESLIKVDTFSPVMPVNVPDKKDKRYDVLYTFLFDHNLSIDENTNFLENVSRDPRIFRLFMQSVQNPLIPFDTHGYADLMAVMVKLSRINFRNAVAYGVMAVGSGSIVSISDAVMQVGHLQGSNFPYVLSALLLGGNALAYGLLPAGVRRTTKKLEELFALVREGKVHFLAADWVMINAAVTDDFSSDRISYKKLAAYVKFARKFLPAMMPANQVKDELARRYHSRRGPESQGLGDRLAMILETRATKRLEAAGQGGLRSISADNALAPVPAKVNRGGVDFTKSFNLKFMGQADNFKNIGLDKPFPFASFRLYITGIEKGVDVKHLLTAVISDVQ